MCIYQKMLCLYPRLIECLSRGYVCHLIGYASRPDGGHVSNVTAACVHAVWSKTRSTCWHIAQWHNTWEATTEIKLFSLEFYIQIALTISDKSKKPWRSSSELFVIKYSLLYFTEWGSPGRSGGRDYCFGHRLHLGSPWWPHVRPVDEGRSPRPPVQSHGRINWHGYVRLYPNSDWHFIHCLPCISYYM